jgi:integrase
MAGCPGGASRLAPWRGHGEYWKPGEAATLIALAREGEPSCAPARVLVFSNGCRKEEIPGLAWQDVDFERRTLAIRRAITRRQVTTPKGGRGRGVAMMETLAH